MFCPVEDQPGVLGEDEDGSEVSTFRVPDGSFFVGLHAKPKTKHTQHIMFLGRNNLELGKL